MTDTDNHGRPEPPTATEGLGTLVGFLDSVATPRQRIATKNATASVAAALE